ncbi:MAG: hypothetical protein JWM91_1176 [Rhodospirillales bacterium]|nr:hypothetical protein [Rhodospirillales bacterium]
MAKLLLIVCALVACGGAPAKAQTTPDVPPPAARLIKPHPGRVEARPAERIHHPLDDRCRPLKERLEFELQKNGNQRRLFQARLAHNAGTRLCREGHAETGISELQRGLSFLQDVPR